MNGKINLLAIYLFYFFSWLVFGNVKTNYFGFCDIFQHDKKTYLSCQDMPLVLQCLILDWNSHLTESQIVMFPVKLYTKCIRYRSELGFGLYFNTAVGTHIVECAWLCIKKFQWYDKNDQSFDSVINPVFVYMSLSGKGKSIL